MVKGPYDAAVQNAVALTREALARSPHARSHVGGLDDMLDRDRLRQLSELVRYGKIRIEHHRERLRACYLAQAENERELIELQARVDARVLTLSLPPTVEEFLTPPPDPA